MDVSSILNALSEERDRVDGALATLEGGPGRSRALANGRRRRTKRRLSVAARKRISELEKIRDRVVSFEEEQRYLPAAGQNLRALTILAVDTGMRPQSELFCLEWPQVQLEASDFMPNGYIKVREGKTKSAERILPLTSRAREVLVVLRADPGRKRWLFPGPGNSGHLTSIQKSHLRALRKAGLDRFPFYCWRHTFGTRCAESGMDRHTLAKLMGHSSPRITEKYYIHVTEPHISSGFERFIAYQAKMLADSQAVTPAR